jgi:hypothetical protein
LSNATLLPHPALGIHNQRGKARLRKKVLSKTLLCLPFFFILHWLYSGGDQERYSEYYLRAASESLLGAYIAQRQITGSAEPVYFIISYSFAKLGLPYFVFKIALSYALAASSALLLTKLRVPFIMIFVLLLTNFYLLALYTELERLSVAIIFLQLAVLRWLEAKTKSSLALLVASLLSHFQISVLLLSIIGGQVLTLVATANTRISRRLVMIVLRALLLFSALLLIIFSTNIGIVILSTVTHKLVYYGVTFDPRYLAQSVAALPFFLYLSRGRIRFLFCYIFLMAFISVLGGERLNIFIVMLTLFAGFSVRKPQNPVLLLFSIFISLKGLNFLLNVFITGRGY